MKIDFRRITTSGKYIPEIDGLRFIAIFSVVLYHILGFINEKYIYRFGRSVLPKYLRKELILKQGNFIEDIISHGSIGVPLFFVISAFVLGLPFANYYLKKGEKVNVKQYF